jgi:hypothetical protein
MSKKTDKRTIMVSSTVYGIEELLDRAYALLTDFGYEVWMSHKGTFAVRSNRSAFSDSLAAVKKCDLFLGIITPNYGSGLDKKNDPDGLSIFHQEVQLAIKLNKPRWMLAHDHVVVSRLLLNKLGFAGKAGRAKLTPIDRPIDLRVIDIYEEAIVDSPAVPVAERTGNWVQKFRSTEDGAVFVSSQFYRYQEVEAFIKENFAGGNPPARKGGQP